MKRFTLLPSKSSTSCCKSTAFLSRSSADESDDECEPSSVLVFAVFVFADDPRDELCSLCFFLEDMTISTSVFSTTGDYGYEI